MAGKYRLVTLGCKVNQYESQQIRELIESFGLVPGCEGDHLDLAVVNTCAVTSEAGRKNRQAIRRLTRSGQTPVIVVGCGASADANRIRELPGVAAVLGHDVDVNAEIRGILSGRNARNLSGVSDTLASRVNFTGEPQKVVGNEVLINPGGATANRSSTQPLTPSSPLPILSSSLPVVKAEASEIGRIDGFAGHQRAFLKVQDGCDAFCTYCIIPQLRPTLRSKSIDAAVSEARSLVEAGHREIILTGIFLGAFGRTTAIRKRFDRGVSSLATLVRSIARIDGLERLRLSSLEPGDVDRALLEVLVSEKACVPHLHLPLQAGSPNVLRRMNRQYTQENFIEMVDRVRNSLDRPAISTDILVGFPGETEADFAETLAVARDSEFCKIHAFPFSSRDGTAAAKWRDQFVPRDIARERLTRLRDLEQEMSVRFRLEFLGEVERVIVEGGSDSDRSAGGADRICHGRADRYFDIHFDASDAVQSGDVVTVRIDRVTPSRTHGTLIPRDGGGFSHPVLLSNEEGSGVSR